VFTIQFPGKKFIGTYAHTLLGSSFALDYFIGTIAGDA